PEPTTEPTPEPTATPDPTPEPQPEPAVPDYEWLMLGGAGLIAVAALIGLLIWHGRRRNG
ncbi:MAG: hypothetical protein Q4A88_03455, partial [Clostridia bacterium]|nr:hypothetical protein [Clostridia bacterium]